MNKWFLKDGQICFKTENAELNNWDLECVVSSLNRKDTEIADLETELLKFSHRISDQNEEILELTQRLAEIEKFIKEETECDNFEEFKKHYDNLLFEYNDFFEVIKNKGTCGLCHYIDNQQIAQLKQQLAEKDAEIQSWKDGTMVVKLGKLEDQLAEKDKEIENHKNHIEWLSTKFANNFAIATLLNLKEWLEPKYFDKEQINYLANVIDQQIKELKGEK